MSPLEHIELSDLVRDLDRAHCILLDLIDQSKEFD
jgi:hypothetical protein